MVLYEVKLYLSNIHFLFLQKFQGCLHCVFDSLHHMSEFYIFSFFSFADIISIEKGNFSAAVSKNVAINHINIFTDRCNFFNSRAHITALCKPVKVSPKIFHFPLHIKYNILYKSRLIFTKLNSTHI